VSKFFPSGQVLLSSGSDRQIKLWNLLDGACAATLKGHVLGVTGIDFIDRGRNFISKGVSSNRYLLI
jgi:proteasomal ATPase-associated factor 1